MPDTTHKNASARLAFFKQCDVNRAAYRSRCETLVPSSVRLDIRPALVSTSACTGLPALAVSISPLAPTFSTATEASAPAVQPLLSRNFCSTSWFMNRITMAFDCAPDCKPTDTEPTL